MILILVAALCLKGIGSLSGPNVCTRNVGNRSSEQCCTGFHEVHAECVPCRDGAFGINCSEKCPPGYYGPKCSLVCNCSSTEVCLPETGCTSLNSLLSELTVCHNSISGSVAEQTKVILSQGNATEQTLESRMFGRSDITSPSSLVSGKTNISEKSDNTSNEFDDGIYTLYMLVGAMVVNIFILLTYRCPTNEKTAMCCIISRTKKHSKKLRNEMYVDQHQRPHSNFYDEI